MLLQVLVEPTIILVHVRQQTHLVLEPAGLVLVQGMGRQHRIGVHLVDQSIGDLLVAIEDVDRNMLDVELQVLADPAHATGEAELA